MKKDYEADNLMDLLKANTKAGAYFKTLPEYVQSTIAERGENIHNFSQLEQYANNLTAGDQ